MARRRGEEEEDAMLWWFYFSLFLYLFLVFFFNFTLSINQIRHDFFYMDHDISRQVTRQRTSKDFEVAVESTWRWRSWIELITWIQRQCRNSNMKSSWVFIRWLNTGSTRHPSQSYSFYHLLSITYRSLFLSIICYIFLKCFSGRSNLSLGGWYQNYIFFY